MQPTDLDLPAMRRPIREALDAYEVHYNGAMKFGDFSDLVLMPEKPNTARTIVPVTYEGGAPLDMYAIVFLPGDGTGDTNTYKLGELQVPEYLQYQYKPERVIPRSKKGVAYEGFFPLFSVVNGGVQMFASSLAELMAQSPEEMAEWERIFPGSAITNCVRTDGFLGSYPNEFLQKLEQGFSPQVYFTTGTKNDRRFGDPHAIHSPWKDGVVQVGGFVAIKDEEHPIRAVTNDWAMPLPRLYD